MELRASHAEHIRSLLDHMEALLAQAQGLGFRSATAEELGDAIVDVRERLGLTRREPPEGAVRALLADLFVAAYELRPEAMKGYGDLSDEQASLLAAKAARLMELANKTLDDLELERERR
jgi:hypothetical protein